MYVHVSHTMTVSIFQFCNFYVTHIPFHTPFHIPFLQYPHSIQGFKVDTHSAEIGRKKVGGKGSKWREENEGKERKA